MTGRKMEILEVGNFKKVERLFLQFKITSVSKRMVSPVTL